MNVRVLFFGMLANRLKTRETSVELDKKDARLSDVLEKVRAGFTDMPEAPYMYALNEEQAGLSSPVRDGDEVAIMPPFSGG